MRDVFGAVEAGGTKFVCAVGGGPDDLLAEVRFPTDDPVTTIAQVVKFFTEESDRHGPFRAIGVASFGPVELRRSHPQYGSITTTPKPGWSGTSVVNPLVDAFHVPVGFDTDVNGAALGEGRWGAASDVTSFAYITIGTGVGGGGLIDGNPRHGLVHPEMGHVAVARWPGDDFPGVCPFHGDCFEGMASGPSIARRWGRSAESLPPTDLAAAVEIEAWYVAQGLRSIVYTCAPERIVVGGGVIEMPGLLISVRTELSKALAGYPGLPEHGRDDFIVKPELGAQAGIAGAFVLAELAAEQPQQR